MKRETFHPAQAQEVADAFKKHNVDYMFIGESGAILLGYPGTTQDVDIFPRKNEINARQIVSALSEIGFDLNPELTDQIVQGKDFVQIKSGPFDVNLVFASDGIESYDEAKKRMDLSSGFPVLNIRDIIASKRSANRSRDRNELPQLEAFQEVYEKRSERSTFA
jgi:hypothetical protein